MCPPFECVRLLKLNVVVDEASASVKIRRHRRQPYKEQTSTQKSLAHDSHTRLRGLAPVVHIRTVAQQALVRTRPAAPLTRMFESQMGCAEDCGRPHALPRGTLQHPGRTGCRVCMLDFAAASSPRNSPPPPKRPSLLLPRNALHAAPDRAARLSSEESRRPPAPPASTSAAAVRGPGSPAASAGSRRWKPWGAARCPAPGGCRTSGRAA